jgi:hypothetical protein
MSDPATKKRCVEGFEEGIAKKVKTSHPEAFDDLKAESTDRKAFADYVMRQFADRHGKANSRHRKRSAENCSRHCQPNRENSDTATGDSQAGREAARRHGMSKP